MKSIIITMALTLSILSNANAQTTAPNWTANDCNSISHTLHSELDNGKVIVLVWVMPCPSCIGPAKTAYTQVQNFAASHPGKVLYYMIDDYGDASCSTLTTWTTNNNIGDVSKITFFGNAGNAISMGDFGGDGMPKVVVVGGTDHTIFFNKNNSTANDASGISSAITSAIAATGITSIENAIQFSIVPNPGTNRVSVNYARPVKEITITAMNGSLVKEIVYETATNNPEIETGQLPAGVYMLKMTDINNETGIQKFVKQ